MTDTKNYVQTIEEVQALKRRTSDWSSPKGLRKDILPWRLWEKAIKNVWDPRDIDFSQDAKDWQNMTEEQRFGVLGLARGFMVGEEGVTLDILPLILAMSDEGRIEETMYLTTFAFEEAKHVDFFRMWFDAIGYDHEAYQTRMRERMAARGVTPPDPDRRGDGMFESELPRVMRRLLTDRSPKAFLDASVTYNQFIEGCLALAGYRVWNQMFTQFGVLPGLREGLTLTQRDERRHIAYGTYLCRRIIAAEPSLFEFAEQRMYELRDGYYGGGQGNGQGNGQQGNGQQGNGQQGYGGGGGPAQMLSPFVTHAQNQVVRRIEVMRKAIQLSPSEAERGTGSEEAEIELENAEA